MKCKNCSTLGPNHLFKECQLYICVCACVQQLRNAPPNTNLEEPSADAPKFLHIEDNMKLKPISEQLLNKFVKLKKDEWLIELDKADHRTKEFRAKR